MYFYQLTLLLNVNILYLIATHHDQTDSHSCRTENARATYQQSPVDSQNLKNDGEFCVLADLVLLSVVPAKKNNLCSLNID